MLKQPIIRLTDYVQEYKDLSYSLYAPMLNIIHCTWYQLDFEETQYDPHYLETYHITGSKSGRRWNKIHMFPVSFQLQVGQRGWKL